MQGIHLEQLMSHYITRTAVATVAKYDHRTWQRWLPRYGLCNGSSAGQVVTLQGCVYWLNMSSSVCVEGIQLEQLMSHNITRTVVATVAKYDQFLGKYKY